MPFIDSASSFPSLSIKSYLARTYAVIGLFLWLFTVGFLMNLFEIRFVGEDGIVITMVYVCVIVTFKILLDGSIEGR